MRLFRKIDRCHHKAGGSRFVSIFRPSGIFLGATRAPILDHDIEIARASLKPVIPISFASLFQNKRRAMLLASKDWQTSADNLRQNRLELGRLIPTGERSGLLTHIAATESVSLCVPRKS
jgi:hypothetical protein